jgi:formylglycine-generating enzyme required for sulfatase activity
VTYAEAEATCQARDGRLCSLEEWRLGCGGPKKQRFPYGSAFARGACNVASIAGFYGEAVQAGAYGECLSPSGALDMVGNVGEWVDGGLAVGGDFATAEREATCQAKGTPPAGYSGAEVGFRCCTDRRAPADTAPP